MMKYTPQNSSRESGMALVFAIGLLALLLMIGMAFIGNAVNYRKAAENNSARSQSRMFALSAVSRAASALMVYAHQYARVPENGNQFPQSFDGIYSYASYNENGEVAKGGAKEYEDGLHGNNSVMMIPPGNGAVIDSRTAESFNQKFRSTDNNAKWPGKWVFFTNGQSGNKRRIIGRAAWQVLGTPADLLAPVFMRGHIDGLDPDPDFIPQENRWGRGVDEVFLGYMDGSSWKAVHNDFRNLGAILTSKDSRLIDYQAIYNVTSNPDSFEVQRWIEKWFIPDFDESKSVSNPGTTITDETYFARASGTDGYGAWLPRFNISELGNGKDWMDAYDVNDGADPWYARFDIDSTLDQSKLNNEEAIKLLARDNVPRLGDGSRDSDFFETDEPAGLPFLKRIGNDLGTFEYLDDLRKQITANFNDYCDADGMPTSDLPAKQWTKDMDDASAGEYKHPTYTGNEKTPYIYELGMNFGLVSSSSTVNSVRAEKDAATGNYRIGIAVKAAPIMKLVNIYPFDPEEKANGKAVYEKFADNDFMRGYVNFGKVDFKFNIQAAIFNGLTFTYDVTTQKYKEVTDAEGNKSWEKDGDPVTETKTFTLETLTLEKAFLDNVVSGDGVFALKNTFEFTSGKWRRREVGSDGVTAIEPVVFGADDLKNTDGNKPYPVKISADKNDKMWQLAPCASDSETTHPMDFSLTARVEDFFEKSGTSGEDSGNATNKAGIVTGTVAAGGTGTLDEFRYAFGGRKTEAVDGAVKTETTYGNAVIGTPASVDIEEVKVVDLSVGDIRRAVLTANVPVGNKAAEEAGVDYVKALGNETSYLLGSSEFNGEFPDGQILKLNPGTETTPNNVPGFVIGAYRNLDPRQNLNSGDWDKSAGIRAVDNFIAPDKAKINELMCIKNDGTGMVNSRISGDVWIPANGDDAQDAEGNTLTLHSDKDWELATEPAWLGTEHKNHISTAVIRNAPMMSPWEIGFIHRGVKWQTINLKKAGYRGFYKNGDNWGHEGSSYSAGDAAIFEQIKMTDRVATYGRINVNMLSHKFANFNEMDHGIIMALFRDLRFNEDPAVFVNNSTRDENGKFLPEKDDAEDFTIDEKYFDGSTDDIVANFTRDKNRENDGKLDFLNYKDTVDGVDRSLANAFSDKIWETQFTDASKEEIIGKTILLLEAETPSPSVVNMIVVAQSIRDVGGEQIRQTDEVTGFSELDGAVVESDGIVTKECEFGRFDYLKHDTDHGKNVYFDEITGETRIFVRLRIMSKGRFVIERIQYL